MARRSKMTDPRVEVILTALRTGNTRTAAAAYAEIDRKTFYNWFADSAFLHAVEKAEADAQVHAVAQVIRAAHGGTWQAAAWWLERRHPDDFGRRDRMDVRIDIRREAERLAAEYGVDADDIIAEADRVAERGR